MVAGNCSKYSPRLFSVSNMNHKLRLSVALKLISKGMSAFAFMAFAMAVVNAALSTANNVNDNNNNNNNNNNDNNNNLANINIANANNAANNENMAMAGRRRRLQRLQGNSSSTSNLISSLNLEVQLRPELFATRVVLQDDQLAYAPLRIGYDDQNEEGAKEEPSLSDLFSDNLSVPPSADPTFIPATSDSLTNSVSGNSTLPSSFSFTSYLDRLLASANSLLSGKRKKRNVFESIEEDDFDQLEGELAQIALAFIGLNDFSSL